MIRQPAAGFTPAARSPPISVAKKRRITPFSARTTPWLATMPNKFKEQP
jgi:hypothetical protein